MRNVRDYDPPKDYHRVATVSLLWREEEIRSSELLINMQSNMFEGRAPSAGGHLRKTAMGKFETLPVFKKGLQA